MAQQFSALFPTNPFSGASPAPDTMGTRVQALERAMAETKKEVTNIGTKLDSVETTAKTAVSQVESQGVMLKEIHAMMMASQTAIRTQSPQSRGPKSGTGETPPSKRHASRLGEDNY